MSMEHIELPTKHATLDGNGLYKAKLMKMDWKGPKNNGTRFGWKSNRN